MSAPSAVALNGAGDLFIADSGLGKVIVVPANRAIAPFALNTRSQSLDFPVSLTFDSNGNLFIGDGGPNGGTPAVPVGLRGQGPVDMRQ